NNPGPALPYPGSYGVIGSGTLRVNGEINVIGQTGGNFGNAIDANLDLGGGTQVVRGGANASAASAAALMFTRTISNGSLVKTFGYNINGVFTGQDGIALLGNNTYAGSTAINGSGLGVVSVATGTNASTSLKVVNGAFSVQGANGSYGSANDIQ